MKPDPKEKPAVSGDAETQSESRDVSPLELATLAARFLPRIGLPERWEGMAGIDLDEELIRVHLMMQPDDRDYCREKRSPFDALAKESLRRAEALLRIASGRKSWFGEQWDAQWDKNEAESKEFRESISEGRRAFERRFGQKDTVTLVELIKSVMGPRTDVNAFGIYAWRQHLKSIEEGNARKRDGGEKVVFEEDASKLTDDGHSAGLRVIHRHRYDLAREIPGEDFPHFYRKFTEFMAENRSRLKGEFAKSSGQKGAKKRIRKDEKEMGPSEAKEGRKVRRAVKKRKLL